MFDIWKNRTTELANCITNNGIPARVVNGTIYAELTLDNLKVKSIGKITIISIHSNGKDLITFEKHYYDAAQQWLLRWFGIEFCIKHNVIRLSEFNALDLDM